MKIRMTIAVFALSLAPALAFAQGCDHSKAKQITASSCKAGTTWDAAKGTCIDTPAS
jgi:predicted outer membrane protein